MLNKNIIILVIVILAVNLVFAQTSKWRVIWDPNPASDSVAYYEIYIGSDSISTNMTLVNTVLHPNTEYTDSLGLNSLGLQPGQIYYYRIKAVNDSGLSSLFSNAAYASIPEITFMQLSLPISTDTTFSLNQPQFVSDPDFGISQLEWDVQDLIPGDSIQHSLLNSNTINFITPTDSTIKDSLLFIVFDPDSFYDEKPVTISLTGVIIPINLPPVVSNIPNQTIIKDESFTSFDLDNYVSDEDNSLSELSWSASGANNLNVNIDINTHVALISILDTSWIGSEVITFRATDPGGLFDEDAAVFTIIDTTDTTTNSSPVITSNPVTEAIVNQTYNYKITASDADNDSLFFILTDNPSFLSIETIDDTSSNLTGIPASEHVRMHQINISVFDGRGGEGKQIFQLTVIGSFVETTNEVSIYPNPWVASKSQSGQIIFENLLSGSKLMIFNLLGEKVFEIRVENTNFSWNVKNNSNLEINSGLYFYALTALKDKSQKIGKIVIIR